MTATGQVIDISEPYWERREIAGQVVSQWGQSSLDGFKPGAKPSSPEELNSWCEGLARKIGVKRDWRIGTKGGRIEIL